MSLVWIVAEVTSMRPGAVLAESDSAAFCLGHRQHHSGNLALQHSFESHSSPQPVYLSQCFHEPISILLYSPLSATGHLSRQGQILTGTRVHPSHS